MYPENFKKITIISLSLFSFEDLPPIPEFPHPLARLNASINFAEKTIMLPDPSLLPQLLTTRMPFGKYKDQLITRLPVSYLEWFNREGFPPGKLGMLLRTLYEIRLNGLDDLLEGIREHTKGDSSRKVR